MKRFLTVIVLVSAFIFADDVVYKQNPIQNTFLLIIDKSGSMSGTALEQAKIGAKHFVGRMKKNDQAGLVSFSSEINEDEAITTNRSSLKMSINRLQAGGSTQLYDALASGVKNLVHSNGTRIIIYLTDGFDSGSNYSLAHVRSMFQGENIYVYGIGLGPKVATTALREISQATGGDFMIVDNNEKLKNIYARTIDSYYASHHKHKTTKGALLVTSIPRKKVVQIDNKNSGSTPLKLTDLNPGTYKVNVYFDYDKVWKKDITIKSGHTTMVKAKAKDADKNLWFISKPHNANVFINGNYVGRTSTNIANTKKFKPKKVMKDPDELSYVGIKPGKYTFEVIGFPDFDYGPEQKVKFEYIVDKDEVFFIDIFKNRVTIGKNEISGIQRKTFFDLMDDSGDLKLNESESEDMFKSVIDEF